ncbi:hypothetical protein GCM10027592_10650 [Spirosoma flavus]
MKKLLLFFLTLLSINTGICQKNLTLGILAGTGKPELILGYISSSWQLGGLSLLRPVNLGIYGNYAITKQIHAGADVSYYRLILQESNKNGDPIIQDKFHYLNIAPYVAYEPTKWVSIAFNISLRPLLKFEQGNDLYSSAATLLSYYGPRLTLKPVKQIGIDIGYENGARSFAVGHIGPDPTLLTNTVWYANIRIAPFAN